MIQKLYTFSEGEVIRMDFVKIGRVIKSKSISKTVNEWKHATVGDIIVAAIKGKLSTKSRLFRVKKGIKPKIIDNTTSIHMYSVSAGVDDAIEKYERVFHTKKSYSELQFDINSAFAKTVMVTDGIK